MTASAPRITTDPFQRLRDKAHASTGPSASGCDPPTESPQFVTVLKPPHRFRRFAVLAAMALAIGVAAHTACQAIDHHDGLNHVVTLCVAAVALLAAVKLAGGERRRKTARLPRWATPVVLIPAPLGVGSFSTSSAWLQRFRN